jgi:DNA-binding beta-propeller fold protein YncE
VVNALVPKFSFVRTDSVKGIDAPASEPHRRHIVYDAAGKRFFVANGAMNRVDVLSPSSAAPLASIDVPGTSSVGLSPDGATLWVGSLPGWTPSLDTAGNGDARRH